MFDSSITLRKLMNDIERVQYRAALAITGACQGTNRNKLYDELGWESLCDRRWFRRLLQFYKIHNNMTPKYLKDNLPPSRQLLYGRTNPNIYHDIRCHTERYMNSFFPASIKSWNNIDKDFHECKGSSHKSEDPQVRRPTSPTTHKSDGHKSDDPQVRRPTSPTSVSPMSVSPMSVSPTVLEITIKMTRNMELKL